MCANFGDPGLRYRELRHKKKLEKNGNFWVENLLIHFRDGTGQDFLDPTGKLQNLRLLTGRSTFKKGA